MSTPCPDCGALLTGAPTCASCGLAVTGPVAGRLWVVDQQLAALARERETLLVQLRPGTAPTTVPAPPVVPTRETTPHTAQNTLLGLGALLLAGAGLVFAAVTYRQLGVTGRAAVLVALTLAAFAGAQALVRRGLGSSGEAVAAVGVYALAGTGKPSTPARLALAGVAVSAALAAITQTVILADQEAFNEFRTWVGGSLEGRGWSVLTTVAPLLVLGGVLSAVIAPALGTLALGDETAHGLGVHVARTRVLALVAVTLLAGASTAAVGPIGFVGLAVPMLARKVVGHDQRWVTASSMLLGATALLLADVLARVVLGHQEVQAGLIAAVVGGPVFVAVVRRRKVPAL